MNDYHDWDIPPDEYYEDKHRRKLQGMLRHLPPGHPDEGDILDALDKMADNARELGLDYEPPANVAAVNTSSERVDKTAENVHEQPAQQPVAWIEHGSDEVPSIVVWERGSSENYTPLYTSPQPSKPWVGLTEEDRLEIWKKSTNIDGAINATATKLREKNA